MSVEHSFTFISQQLQNSWRVRTRLEVERSRLVRRHGAVKPLAHAAAHNQQKPCRSDAHTHDNVLGNT